MERGAARFDRRDRLLRSNDFRSVAREGERVAGRAFILLGMLSNPVSVTAERSAPPGGEGTAFECRLGVTVSRKVGDAVTRNRVKRRIREWFRLERAKSQFAAGLQAGTRVDLVVIARPSAADLETREIWDVLSKMWRRLREAS